MKSAVLGCFEAVGVVGRAATLDHVTHALTLTHHNVEYTSREMELLRPLRTLLCTPCRFSGGRRKGGRSSCSCGSQQICGDEPETLIEQCFFPTDFCCQCWQKHIEYKRDCCDHLTLRIVVVMVISVTLTI